MLILPVHIIDKQRNVTRKIVINILGFQINFLSLRYNMKSWPIKYWDSCRIVTQNRLDDGERDVSLYILLMFL